MTKEEFFIRLCELAKLPKPSAATLNRPVWVAVSYANYGEPSAAIIELQGSGPHLTTMVGLYSYGCEPVLVNNKLICWRRSESRVRAIQDLVSAFLTAQGNMRARPSKPFDDELDNTACHPMEAPVEYLVPSPVLKAPTGFCEPWIEGKLRERLEAYKARYPAFKLERVMDKVMSWPEKSQRWAPYMEDKDIRDLNKRHHKSQSMKHLASNAHL